MINIFAVIGIFCVTGFILYVVFLKLEGKSDSVGNYEHRKSFEITSKEDYYIVYTLVSNKEFTGAIFFSSPSCTEDFLRKQESQKCDDGKHRVVLASHCDAGHVLTFILCSNTEFEVENALQGKVAERKWWDIVLSPLGF